jgi:hypothetical protein
LLPSVVGRLRADVAVVVGGETCYYDVVVTNPASKTCLESHHPDVIPLTAATLVEKAKLSKYRKVYNSQNNLEVVANNVIPFALESTGRLGKCATDSIFMLAKLKDVVPDPNPRLAWARRFLLNRVSVVCARARAMMVELFRANVKFDVVTSPTIMQKNWIFNGRSKEYEDEIELIYDFMGDRNLYSHHNTRSDTVGGTEVASLQE